MRIVENHFIGVDLGRDVSHSALAVATLTRTVTQRRDPANWALAEERALEVSYLDRVPLGVKYTDVIDRIACLVKALNAQAAWGYQPPTIYMTADAAGPGQVAIDVLRKQDLGVILQPAIITGGEEAHRLTSGAVTVPRKELLSTVKLMLESGTLVIGKHVRHRDQLVKEGAAVNAASSRQREHDDLIIALALATWQALRLNKSMARLQRAA
jgi:hypothetical protein